MASQTLTNHTDAEFDKRILLVEEAIDRYGDYLQHYLYSLTRQWQDAENLTNELWIHVLHRFSEDKINHVGILRRKAYQLYSDFWRKQRRSPITSVETLPEIISTTANTEIYSQDDEEQFKENFFKDYNISLTELQRDAVWLFARYGFTYKEIAEKLNTPSSTIGDWIKHARHVFSQSLELNRYPS